MSSESETTEIREQTAFYFSDSNWWRDAFIRRTAEQNGGWVPVDVLLTFRRLKALTTDPEVLLTAIAGHPDIEISEDRTKLRKTNIATAQPNFDDRTVRAKELGQGATIDNVRALFVPYGKVNCVRLPTNKKTGKFIGRVFIEFETREGAEKAAAASGQLKVAGALSVKPEGAEEALTVELLEDWYKRRPDKARSSSSAKRAKPSGEAKDGEDGEEKKGGAFTPGLIVHYRFEADSAAVDFHYMKGLFAAYGEGPAFVTLTEGNESHEGDVRMKHVEDARAAVAALNENPELANSRKGVFHILADEQEQQFWDTFRQQASDRRGRPQRGKGGRGGRGGRGKRQRSN